MKKVSWITGKKIRSSCNPNISLRVACMIYIVIQNIYYHYIIKNFKFCLYYSESVGLVSNVLGCFSYSLHNTS